jgi:4-hydroxy-4-methyl-2-oxoglutarate aldolase
LVVDVGAGQEWGYWGEILSEAAVAARLGGVVINGCVRDRDELVKIGFPVFATGLCIRGTSKSSAGGQLGQSLTVGRATVRPGDLIVGDADGVVALSAASVPQVVAAARSREEKERSIIESIRAGRTTVDLYGFEPL